MWYEFFKFELKYRIKRPETFLFFLFLLLFSIFGVEFIFQGVELGLVKKNSPLIIAKTMGVITGITMVIASMIMGVSVLRDTRYGMASLIYANPISKKDYLLGHFLGSLAVLLLVFSAVLWGMMLGEFMPWAKPAEYLDFSAINYVQPFLWVALPILFFGAALFFTAGALSKKLMVVYTQGLVIFVLFMLTKAFTNETLQALFDPFSLTTLTKSSEGLSAAERNTHLIPVYGIMLFNKLLWVISGIITLLIGYAKFNLKTTTLSTEKKIKKQVSQAYSNVFKDKTPIIIPSFGFKEKLVQLFSNAWFHGIFTIKLTSFWALVVVCFVIIFANSLNLGTYYGVDSYPTTYLIIEELQEISIYFFMAILVFYSGEIIWKESDANFYLIHDATPLSGFVNIGSRFLGLMLIYVVIMISLILGGILFQAFNGYYNFELKVYFFGFFLEILPFLALYTFVSIFFQTLTGNKFIGILLTITFVIANFVISRFGIKHGLLNFGGQSLAKYSDMNGYGHFLQPYLFIKSYWMLFGIILLVFSSILQANSKEITLKRRWSLGLKRLGKSTQISAFVCLYLFAIIGAYIFYNTNVLNDFWSKTQQDNFRAEYENTLKYLEYIPQPKIVDERLNVSLFPSKRSYEINGSYFLINTSSEPISEIHIQKKISSKIALSNVSFDCEVKKDEKYAKFYYDIYRLSQPLVKGDTIKMRFTQIFSPKGFELDDVDTDVLYNGTFFDNSELPTFGYNKKYELTEASLREELGLSPRPNSAKQDDKRELVNARNGSDSDGIKLEMLISTETPQTAITSGDLVAKWQSTGRNYFQYKTHQSIINFYPIVSAKYEILKEKYLLTDGLSKKPIDLEIYYQKGNEYNLHRMMDAMKASLKYYSTQFSPYPYKQLRITEFPRYQSFAQSFPSIIPFSESSGFVLKIDDKKDVDMAFFITAHEVAHQWWGCQLEAANVQGQKMILEALAQYSALMVFKQKYSDEKVQQFLKLQLDLYQKALLKSKKVELPLALVENESHIYYNKGAINMYEFQKQIGEQRVNLALKNFLNEWKSLKKNKRYATTKDLIQYFREQTPKTKQKVITELFEKVSVGYGLSIK